VNNTAAEKSFGSRSLSYFGFGPDTNIQRVSRSTLVTQTFGRAESLSRNASSDAARNRAHSIQTALTQAPKLQNWKLL
jgi:hypothetical protein